MRLPPIAVDKTQLFGLASVWPLFLPVILARPSFLPRVLKVMRERARKSLSAEHFGSIAWVFGISPAPS
jgi:hypothetical protein